MTTPHLMFTESAKVHLQKTLKLKGENAYFRLGVKQTGCSGYMYVPSVIQVPGENDVLIPQAEVPTCVDSAWAKILDGVTVDYVSHRLGQYQLFFHNPNAVGMCGCGESFHLKEAV